MAQVEVMLHPDVHKTKPTIFSKTTEKLLIKSVTLTELAEHVSKGSNFYPSVHNLAETVKEETFSHQQLCLVDIDNVKTEKTDAPPYMFTEENIIELAEQYKLDVAFIYRTHSYTEALPKFRVGFIADRVFTEYEGLLKEAHNALFKIFNSVSTERLVDTSCNEASRYYAGALYGSKPYVNEDAALFNAETLIELTKNLPEVPEKKEQPKKNGNKIQKGESNNTTASLEAIRAGDVHAFRTFFLENLQNNGADSESRLSHFAYKALTENVEDVIVELDIKYVYELFNQLPMADLFSLPSTTFTCVVHDDSRPSASITTYPDGNDMYKCFTDGCICYKGYSNFMLLEHFVGSKRKAFRFINTFFGIEVHNELTECVAQNESFIESDKFKETCPTAYELISRSHFKRKLFETLKRVASVVTPVQLTKDENDCSFFYSMSEIEKLMEGTIAGTSPDAISQMMSFAALLRLVNKRADEDLTDDAYNKLQDQRLRTAERTKQEASEVRRLSVYSIPLISEMNLNQLEAIAIKAKNSGISASKMNCNLVVQAFGEQTAKLVYPTEKSTVVSYKKHADVIRVKKAIQTCLQKHNVADKTTVKEILGSLVKEMSRREFDNAYSIALAELGLQTEVVTNMHRELFAKDFPRNTRISFYSETLEALLNGEEEIETEEMPVAVGAETSVFMQTIIASLNNEECQEEVTPISHVTVEAGEIPIVSDTESNCSLKTEFNRKAAIKLNAIKPMSVVNKILIEVFNEHNQLVGYRALLMPQNQPTRKKSRVTKREQASYIYDYVNLKRCKKRASAGQRMPYSRCKPNNNWKVYTLDTISLSQYSKIFKDTCT